jgi:hypothetical protein
MQRPALGHDQRTVESEAPERAVHQGFLRVLRNEYIIRASSPWTWALHM